jgi:hypothetical protein
MKPLGGADSDSDPSTIKKLTGKLTIVLCVASWRTRIEGVERAERSDASGGPQWAGTQMTAPTLNVAKGQIKPTQKNY